MNSIGILDSIGISNGMEFSIWDWRLGYHVSINDDSNDAMMWLGISRRAYWVQSPRSLCQ